MESLAGLLAFSVGLGLLVFPEGVTEGVGDRLGREAGHREAVAVRGLGVAGTALGFALVLI